MKLFWIVENGSVQSESMKVSLKGRLTHLEIISYLTRKCDGKILSLRIQSSLNSILEKDLKKNFKCEPFVYLCVYVYMSVSVRCVHILCHWVATEYAALSLLTYLFEGGSVFEPREHIYWLGWRSTSHDPPVSNCCSAKLTDMYVHMSGLLHRYWDLTSSPHASIASTLYS